MDLHNKIGKSKRPLWRSNLAHRTSYFGHPSISEQLRQASIKPSSPFCRPCRVKREGRGRRRPSPPPPQPAGASDRRRSSCDAASPGCITHSKRLPARTPRHGPGLTFPRTARAPTASLQAPARVRPHWSCTSKSYHAVQSEGNY